MDVGKRYCKNCGAEIKTDSKFCFNCGAAFDNTPSSVSRMQKTSPVTEPQKAPRKGLFAFSSKKSVKKENISSKIPKTRTITEIRCTCNSCGKVWHYGKQEQLQNVGNAMSNLGKSMSCCTGCLPAVFIPDKKVVDLNKCPNCNSKNIKKEQIAHAVPK